MISDKVPLNSINVAKGSMKKVIDASTSDAEALNNVIKEGTSDSTAFPDNGPMNDPR